MIRRGLVRSGIVLITHYWFNSFLNGEEPVETVDKETALASTALKQVLIEESAVNFKIHLIGN